MTATESRQVKNQTEIENVHLKPEVTNQKYLATTATAKAPSQALPAMQPKIAAYQFYSGQLLA